MSLLEEKEIGCPHCGEIIDVLVDCSVEQQVYVEDCHVCCRPILLSVRVGEGGGIAVEKVKGGMAEGKKWSAELANDAGYISARDEWGKNTGDVAMHRRFNRDACWWRAGSW